MIRISRLFLFAALLALTAAAPADARASNVWPLAFGMTPQQVADALQSPLVYVSGPRGSEVFVTTYEADTPGFVPVDARIYLQFRRGHLTGWKKDWRVRPRVLF